MRKIYTTLLLIFFGIAYSNAFSYIKVGGSEANGTDIMDKFIIGEEYNSALSVNATFSDGEQEDKGPNPTAVISGDFNICSGGSAPLSISFTGSGPWYGNLSDGTSFTTMDNPFEIIVFPSTTTNYTVTSLSDLNGSAVSSDLTGSATVTIANIIANAGSDTTVCGGLNAFYDLQFQNAIGVGGNATWSTSGNGWFDYSSNDNLAPLYNFGDNDLFYESVLLTLTVTNEYYCSSYSTVTLTLVEPPTAIIDPAINNYGDIHICEGSTYSFSNAQVSPGSSIVWSGGDGSFNNPGILNPIYTPGPQDIFLGHAIINLNATSGFLPCNQSSFVNLVIDPAPTPPANLACYQTATLNPNTCSWDVTGTQPDQPTLACYESATFNSITCVWDITGTPVLANAGADASTCVGTDSIYNLLQQNVTGSGGTISWTSSGDGWFEFITNNSAYNELTPLYHIGPNDIDNGNVTLTLTIVGDNNCEASSSFTLSIFSAVAIIDATLGNSGSLNVCAGGSYSFSNAQVSEGSFIAWTGGDGSFNDYGIQNPIYTPGPQDSLLGYATINLTVYTVGESILCTNSSSVNLIIDPAPAPPTNLACYETAIYNGSTCSWVVSGTPNVPIIINTSSCNSYTWPVNNSTYTASGNYSYTENCQDYQLNLIINQSTTSTEITSKCNSYTWNGTTYTQSGTYTYNTIGANGCDSTATLILTINNAVAVINPVANTQICPFGSISLQANTGNGLSYQWQLNGNNINGATASNYNATDVGNYSVVVTNTQGCTASSSISITSSNTCVAITKLRSADCGKLNFAINAALLADLVAGATNYDFEFTNLTTNSVAVKTSTSNSVSLSSIVPAITFDTQYNVRVRAKVNGTYANYGPVCTIGTVCNPAICGVPLTQLRSTDCGKINLSPLTGQIIADIVAAASQYEFEFRNINTNALYATRLQTSNALSLSAVTPVLQWNTQYNVKVRAYISGVAGNYGNNCVIGIMPDPNVATLPNTQLTTTSCGALNLALTSTITCLAVNTASSYEWEFRDQTNTTIVANITTTTTSLALNTVSGLQWNTQYNVRVRALSTGVSGNYSTSCLIGIIPDPGIVAVPTTKLRTADCGRLNFGLAGTAVADLVAGAVEYEFEFRNNSTNALIANRLQPSNVLTFSTVPALQWNTQYKVSVRARISATWGSFGTSCTIGFICDPNICGVPSTALRTADCGKLNVSFSSGFVVANTVAGATSYAFEITDISTGLIVSVQNRTGVNLFINTITPALSINKQYSIRVRATISGVVGNYGSACTIGFASGSRDSENEEVSSINSWNADTFELQLFPNPFNSAANLIITSDKNQQVMIQIIDISGRLVYETKHITNENLTIGDDLAAGNYVVKIQTNDGKQLIQKMIKSE